jgi:hypothetical protein
MLTVMRGVVLVAFGAALGTIACDGKGPVGPTLVTLRPDAGGPDAGVAEALGIGGKDSGDAGDARADAGDGATAPPPEFYACKVDSDCVAVPKVGCCNNGYKEAVNAKSTDAYAKSFVCPTPNAMCAQFLVNDNRAPECSAETGKCELVAIDKIACGALHTNPHACPTGYRCVLPKTPDVPGRCQK